MVPDKVYLASKSPRRLELLGLAFNNVQQINSLLEEPKWQRYQTPAAYLEQCMEIKARGAREAYERTNPPSNWALIVAADTVVVRGSKVYGKPDGKAGAFAMLTELMGKEHSVLTAYYVGLYRGSKLVEQHHACIATRVKFRKARASEIQAYVQSGEPLDKSGSYGVQGPALQFVAKIDGSYASVMGLPVYEVYSKVEGWRAKYATATKT